MVRATAGLRLFGGEVHFEENLLDGFRHGSHPAGCLEYFGSVYGVQESGAADHEFCFVALQVTNIVNAEVRMGFGQGLLLRRKLLRVILTEVLLSSFVGCGECCNGLFLGNGHEGHFIWGTTASVAGINELLSYQVEVVSDGVNHRTRIA